MKKLFLTSILFLTFSCLCIGQCSQFYPFSKGAKSTLTLYNEKGKSQGTITYEVLSISNTSEGEKANISTSFKDEKGKDITTTNYDATCKNGTVSIDFNSLMRPGLMDAYSNMEVDSQITGTNLDIPNNLSVGQKLGDAEMNIKISLSGMNFNMTTLITDREVVGKEKITTPAGTFDCYVISQSNIAKGMAGTMKSNSKQWLAEGVGVVKTEDYNKKGKLEGYGILTAFKK
ncbi:MAG: hypothetical protein R2793_04205 [Flavobacteriaceae bacterium]